MSKGEVLTAIESKRQILRAVDDWEAKLADGAVSITGLSGAVYWHESLGVWGHFYKGLARTQSPGKYWNVFGRVPNKLRQNIIVEINPPGAGINKGVQGAIAIDSKGSRWALHQGRLHPSGVRISREEFDAATSRLRASVAFSDGSILGYYKVANIDAPADVLQRQLASFVQECSRVRTFYVAGQEAADQDAMVVTAEQVSSPEQLGSHINPPRDAVLVEHKHAEVWHALTAELDRLGAMHSNGRIGLHGPDLRTFSTPRLLFEIKSECSASDLQTGVGQLLLYEQLLGASYRKVLVLPRPPQNSMSEAIGRLGINQLHYQRKGRKVLFNSEQLRRLTSKR